MKVQSPQSSVISWHQNHHTPQKKPIRVTNDQWTSTPREPSAGKRRCTHTALHQRPRPYSSQLPARRQNHRIVRVGKDLQRSPTLLPRLGHPEQVTKERFQVGLEWLRRGSPQNQQAALAPHAKGRLAGTDLLDTQGGQRNRHGSRPSAALSDGRRHGTHVRGQSPPSSSRT